jgi:hypothetical protein
MSNHDLVYRPLTDWERRLILHLLDPPFSGREVLRAQLGEALGRPIDENGSLDLQSGLDTRAAVMKRVPTEGSATDRDGATIHYLLHVVDGAIQELEVYKDDSSKVVQHPQPEAVEVIILG